MRQTFRDHPYAALGFLLAVVVTLFFLGRMVSTALYWHDPAHHNESVKPWMTVGYIAKSWHVDPRQIDQMAGFPGPRDHGPWTMRQIAEQRGVPVDVIIKLANDTVAALEKARPPVQP